MKHDEEKHLVIQADADTRMGSGHLMRCLALGQTWNDTGGRVIFVTACQNEGLLRRLREEQFEIYMSVSRHPEAGDWDHFKDILADYPDAWVVLDGYHFDETYQQNIKQTGHRLLVIDDTAHLKHYYADILLNQNLGAEELHYSAEHYTHFLLGTPYVLLRREFLDRGNRRRQIPKSDRKVLVTLGGGDPDNYTLKVVQALQNINIVGLEATVIIGASNPHTDTLERAIGKGNVPIHLVRDATNMPELMTWADIAISGGGTTCWELAFMGVPMIVTVLADNQRGIAAALHQTGTTVNLGWYAGVTIDHIGEALARLLTEESTRAKMSRLGQKLVDGDGGQRLLAAISAGQGEVSAHSLHGE